MDIYVIQKNGYNNSCSCDEFGQRTNNLVDSYGYKSRNRGWLQTQNEYILTIDGALRDREFEQTYREFIKWLVRLGKRVQIEHLLVEVKGYGKSTIVTDRYIQNEKYSYKKVFENLFEDPSWSNETGEVSWTEFLMWDRAKDSDYPLLLAYKYFRDKENNEEAKRRLSYLWGENQINDI